MLEDQGRGSNGKTEDRDVSVCIWVKGLEGWETRELFQLGHGYRKYCFQHPLTIYKIFDGASEYTYKSRGVWLMKPLLLELPTITQSN